MAKQKPRIPVAYRELAAEAAGLLDRLETEFRGIGGPPLVTLSVARGYDDQQSAGLAALAKEQAHHIHWSVVSDQEMDRYQDCWAFMDAAAVKFYLPAFISRHLRQLSEAPSDRVIVPDWFPIECITLGPERISTLSVRQLEFVSDYLGLVEREATERLGDDSFRATRQAWEKDANLARKQPIAGPPTPGGGAHV